MVWYFGIVVTIYWDNSVWFTWNHEQSTTPQHYVCCYGW